MARAFVVVGCDGIYETKDILSDNKDKLGAKLLFVRQMNWDDQFGLAPEFYDWDSNRPDGLMQYWRDRDVLVAELPTNSISASDAFLRELVNIGALRGRQDGSKREMVNNVGTVYKINYVLD